MPLGYYDLRANGEYVTVEVADPDNVQYPVVEVPTPNGWGCVPLVDPEDADTPIEVKTRHGWKGLKKQAELEIDFFERDSLQHYSGGTPNYSCSTYRSSQGSRSLRASTNGGVTQSIISSPGDGLPYYPSRGDTIKMDVNFNRLNDVVRFGFFHGGGGSILQDSYELHFQLDENSIRLFNDNDGDLTPLCDTGVNFGADTWDEVEIETDNSGITVRYRGSTMSTGNTARDGGGITFSTSGPITFFDNIRARTG